MGLSQLYGLVSSSRTTHSWNMPRSGPKLVFEMLAAIPARNLFRQARALLLTSHPCKASGTAVGAYPIGLHFLLHKTAFKMFQQEVWSLKAPSDKGTHVGQRLSTKPPNRKKYVRPTSALLTFPAASRPGSRCGPHILIVQRSFSAQSELHEREPGKDSGCTHSMCHAPKRLGLSPLGHLTRVM